MQTRGIVLMLFAFSLLMLGSIEQSSAQVSVNRKYRVIAYKTGSPQIFSVSNEVNIIPNMSIYIPNTFTPNGDGLNDTFGVAGEAILEFNMKIFNRWGQLIYETSNANERWDGTYLGQKVPMGTYVYKVTASSPNGARQNKEGNINVVM